MNQKQKIMKKILLFTVLIAFMFSSNAQISKKQSIFIGTGVGIIVAGIAGYDLIQQDAYNNYESKLTQQMTLGAFSVTDYVAIKNKYDKDVKLATYVRTASVLAGAIILIGTIADISYDAKGLAINKNLHLNSEGTMARLTYSF